MGAAGPVAARLASLGVHVEHRRFEGQIHAFYSIPLAIPADPTANVAFNLLNGSSGNQTYWRNQTYTSVGSLNPTGLDTVDKTTGKQVFGMDLKLPGMLNAAIRRCPVFGGTLKSYDEAAIARRPGVKKVVKVKDTGVAVVADTWWRAKKALDALPIVWDEPAVATSSSAKIADFLKEGLTVPETNGERKQGDALGAIAGAAKKVEATYSTPFLAHACMEVMNATVRLTADKAECWTPTQNLEASIAALSEASGLPLAKCEVYRHDLGGGFGRRGGTQDYVHQAVEIAKEFPGIPVKLIWSREEDQAHDFYRPISQCKLSAGLDDKGNLVGLHVRVSGQSINATLNPAGIQGGKDMRQLQGYWAEPGDAQLGYTVPNLLVEYAMRNTHVPVGPWRGVNTNQNAVYMECFIEECAKAAGKDSLEFRRAMMKDYPKHLAVLNAAAEKGDWGKPLPPGVHRGIAQFMGYGSYSAATAEVSVSPQGKLKIHRMVLATNCGHAVNPHQIAAQVEGGVAYGLSATLYGEMPVDNQEHRRLPARCAGRRVRGEAHRRFRHQRLHDHAGRRSAHPGAPVLLGARARHPHPQAGAVRRQAGRAARWAGTVRRRHGSADRQHGRHCAASRGRRRHGADADLG